ncbi:hypothetical protein LTR41_001138 [Exophiala xenobiotica]|nr:hypothetical protein LTR41_001138 [Exophiala xenobiotica]
MDDLQPYMCPFTDCTDVNAMFSRRVSLLRHIRQHEMVTATQIHHETQTHAKCPFCDVTYLPGPRGNGGRAYIKHIGHHMEEIAFGVVSTAYENWSYDDSGSELEPPNLYTHFDYFSGKGFSFPAAGDFEGSWIEKQYTHDDTQYEMNFWTGSMTPVSSASSANSGLRDPYPVDYLSAGSAGSKSPKLSRRHSMGSTKRHKRVTRKYPQNNTGRETAESRLGKRKGPGRPEERRQAKKIRKLRACLRCRLMKKTCDKGEPCDGCQPSYARISQIPCTCRAIKDLGYFLKDWKQWKADGGVPGAIFPISNVKGISDREQTVFVTHGYGFCIPTTAREVFLRDESLFGAHASTAMASVSDSISTQHTGDGRAKLLVNYSAFTRDLMMEYLDMHIDHQFEALVDANYKGQLFVVDCLKTTYRYVLRSPSDILRQALRLMVAYNLTLQPTMEQRLEVETDDLCIREGNPISLFPAPVMVARCVKQVLADLWRDIHEELLDGLDKLYTSAYSGDKLKDWDQILFVTVVVLAVWEQMQSDSHSRVAEGPVVERFCSDTEDDPVRVLTGLFCTISHQLPRFEEWDTPEHGSKHFVGNVALHDALTEMRAHVIKHESYLRSRSWDAKFDRSDPGSLSCKFLARIFLRESRPPEQPHDKPQEISPMAVMA